MERNHAKLNKQQTAWSKDNYVFHQQQHNHNFGFWFNDCPHLVRENHQKNQ